MGVPEIHETKGTRRKELTKVQQKTPRLSELLNNQIFKS